MATIANRLTGKQECFAQQVALGRPLSDAYRTSYNAQGMQAPCVWTAASRMASHPKVALRIKALMAEKEAQRRMQGMTRAEVVLSQLEDIASTAPSDLARLRALELLGKHLGLFAATQQASQQGKSPDHIQSDIVSKLERLGILKSGGAISTNRI